MDFVNELKTFAGELESNELRNKKLDYLSMVTKIEISFRNAFACTLRHKYGKERLVIVKFTRSDLYVQRAYLAVLDLQVRPKILRLSRGKC